MSNNGHSSGAIQPDLLSDGAIRAAWLEVVERQVRALKSGAVQISVQDGRIVEVETFVRVRSDKLS